jgi:hypothetical protein
MLIKISELDFAIVEMGVGYPNQGYRMISSWNEESVANEKLKGLIFKVRSGEECRNIAAVVGSSLIGAPCFITCLSIRGCHNALWGSLRFYPMALLCATAGPIEY